MQNADQEKLVEQLKARDRQALKLFYNDFFHHINYLVDKLINNPTEAKDLTHDVFLSMHKALPSLKSVRKLSQLKAYVYVTARNKAYDYLKEKTSAAVSLKKLAQTGMDAYDPVSINEIFQNELHFKVNEEVRKLKERDQELVKLIYGSNLKYKQIAGMLNISEGTVKSRKGIIIKTLKDGLTIWVFFSLDLNTYI